MVTCDIDFVLVYIFNLLIKTYLLILIKYLNNESKVKIKSLGQKCFTNKIIKLLLLWNFYYIKALFLNIPGQCYIKTGY